MPIKAIIFDLDGVLYKGRTAIPGAQNTIAKLKSMGKRVFFLTNAGTASRSGRTAKLRSLGFEVEEQEVYTSSYGVGHYISKMKKNSTVYCIGEGGLKEQLTSFGIFLTDKKPDFVVVSLDRGLTYARLAKGFENILNGSKFIATNEDPSFPTEKGLMPGAGSIVKSLEYSTGVKPIVIGKPNTYLMDMIFEKCECSKEEILFVGDRLDTDIKIAKKTKIKSALVLTGVSKKNDLNTLNDEEKPDYVLSSVADVFKVL